MIEPRRLHISCFRRTSVTAKGVHSYQSFFSPKQKRIKTVFFSWMVYNGNNWATEALNLFDLKKISSALFWLKKYFVSICFRPALTSPLNRGFSFENAKSIAKSQLACTLIKMYSPLMQFYEAYLFLIWNANNL